MSSDYLQSIGSALEYLIDYAAERGLIGESERIYSYNMLLDALCINEAETDGSRIDSLYECLKIICDHACRSGIIEDSLSRRDLFDTKIMGLLTPRPSEVIRQFKALYEKSPERATDYFYRLSQDSNYIRRDRISRDERWTVDTRYGELEISINLSKPEKDPRDIAAAKLAKPSGYPKCLLCIENEGYSGSLSHPARQNLRIIPVDICGEKWGFQYSPYVYYNEHCIVMNSRHVPMVIDDKVFYKLFAFTEQFPHYFVGSNADLPIVGGSILSHEHFQGGRHDMPMKNAAEEYPVYFRGFENVKTAVLRYPMTAIRLNGESKDEVCRLASKILRSWRGYTDAEAFVFAETQGERHNTITPIARMNGGRYELDLVLRNNITTAEHPLGVYHPHAHLHHIKKENIGLIEVQGLAILPGRLKDEIRLLRELMLAGADIAADPRVSKHAEWVSSFSGKYSNINGNNIDGILRKEIGLVFSEVLECAGVFKCTPEGRRYLNRFIEKVNEG